MLKNPWVIGGALVLVVVVVAYSGGSSGSTTGNAQGAIASGEALNMAGMKYAAQDYQTQAQVALAGQEGNVRETLGMFSALSTMNGQAAQVQQTLDTVNASIINNSITVGGMLAADRINSNLKLSQTYIGAQVATAQINANVQTAGIAAKTAKTLSNNQLFGNIANNLSKVAMAAIAA